MKYLLSCILFVAIATGSLAPATAEAAKPIAVLSLASHDDLQGSTDGLGEMAKVPDLPTWLSSTLKLFDEGKGASGLDSTRPWGVVLQLDDCLSAYAFVPVRDAEYLLWDLDKYIDETEEVGWETYRVKGTEPGKQLYAKLKDGWVFVAENREDLNDVPDDPAALLNGLEKKYDVALCVETKNIPAEEGRAIIELLGSKFGSMIGEHVSDAGLNFLGEALYATEQVTMGWTKH